MLFDLGGEIGIPYELLEGVGGPLLSDLDQEVDEGDLDERRILLASERIRLSLTPGLRKR